VNHYASPEFWFHYRKLLPGTQQLADKNFALIKENPHHPSVRLKKVGRFWSARIGQGIAPWQKNAKRVWCGFG